MHTPGLVRFLKADVHEEGLIVRVAAVDKSHRPVRRHEIEHFLLPLHQRLQPMGIPRVLTHL